METINPNIPYCKFDNNEFRYLSSVTPLTKFGIIKSAPNQPEVILILTIVITSKNVLYENIITK